MYLYKNDPTVEREKYDDMLAKRMDQIQLKNKNKLNYFN